MENDELTEEQIQTYLKTWGTIKSKIRILPREGHFGLLAPFITEPKKTVIALDWDQTVTQIVNKHLGPLSQKTIRGGELSRAAIQKYFDDGVELIVITAQAPNANIMHNLRSEVTKLGLHYIFRVSQLENNLLYKLFTSWGKNQDLSLLQLTRKLATLIVILSSRYPADLARIGPPSRVTINPERTKVLYQLQILEEDNPAKGDFGATQILEARKEKIRKDTGEEVTEIISDDYTCPVRTWHEYLERTSGLRRKENGKEFPERLFLRSVASCDASGNKVYEAMSMEEMIEMVRGVLEESQSSEEQIRMKINDPVKIINGEGGQVSRLGNLFASRYNKPEALVQFLKDNPERTELIFVDDNSDNAWNMFVHFGQQHLAPIGEQNIIQKTITSLWYPFPPGGRDENFYEPFRVLVRRLNDSYGDSDSRILLGELPLNIPVLVSTPDLSIRFPKNADGPEEARRCFVNHLIQLLYSGWSREGDFENLGWGLLARVRGPDGGLFHSVYIYSGFRKKGKFSEWVSNNSGVKLVVFSDVGLEEYESTPSFVFPTRLSFPEYPLVEAHFNNQTSQARNHPMNRIDEVIFILKHFGYHELTQRAYALHPLLQDEALKKFWGSELVEKTDPRVLLLAMEFSRILNGKEVQLSSLSEVNHMLIAEKIHKRKDYEALGEQSGQENNIEELWKGWFKVLEIQEEKYQLIKNTIHNLTGQ